MKASKPRDHAQILIRPATKDDFPEIVRMGNRSFPYSGISEQKILERAGRGHVIFIALIDGKPVGFIDLKIGAFGARVTGLATDQPFRGVGIGTALLEHSVEFSRHIGKLSVKLRVAARNLKALNLYRKLGFIVVSRRARKDGRAVYTMERKFET